MTNTTLVSRSGSELYVCDVATKLLERGHTPIAYAPILGPLAADLRRLTIPVVDDLDGITEPPDVIHGHHNFELMTALLRFPGVPAVRICHGWDDDRPQPFPRVLRFVCVDHTVRDRAVSEWGLPTEKVEVLLNFVDLGKFQPRGALPARPSRALVFSNSAGNYLETVRRACEPLGITVDAAGANVGAVTHEPETLLGQYDIVFAKARCAIEALAIGDAVVLCDFLGLGPMVTTANFESLRRMNFGKRALTSPIDAATIAEQIRKYDPTDAAKVSGMMRATAGLDSAVDRLLQIYEDVIVEWRTHGVRDPEADLRAASAYLRSLRRVMPRSSLRYHLHAILRESYYRLEGSRLTRWILPSRGLAARIGGLIK